MNQQSIKMGKSPHWQDIIFGFFAIVIVAAILNISIINWMFFPECNRQTRDCFLVENLWGAK